MHSDFAPLGGTFRPPWSPPSRWIPPESAPRSYGNRARSTRRRRVAPASAGVDRRLPARRTNWSTDAAAG
ncbi:hypothetical protein CapIbe_013767 [Capra ibex]